MKCEFWDSCHSEATEKHHISYFPEVTVGVCAFHGDDIHKNPQNYPGMIKFKPGDSTRFYSQQDRLSDFIKNLGRRR